jgi:hypothetical protein
MTGSYESLQTIVGQETYTVWKKMLCELVPDGRAHRLAPMVAGMLQYAAAIAYEKYGDNPEAGSAADITLLASEVYDPEEAIELLGLITRLFEDAGVGYQRANRQGDEYNNAESVVYEYIHWYDMPWEA